MATFNYTVDTTPMADELSSVSRNVNGTTAAVGVMQTAVIIAETKASDLICSNVNKGFYSLIRSQISQKMAKLQSDVDSHLMQLVQQKKALLSIKDRMNRDYNMISSRYTKLFNGLNSMLRSRIFELDKPVIEFACKEIDKISNRTRSLTATIPVSQTESISMSQKLVVSNVKQKSLGVISAMRNFVYDMAVQKKLTDNILINDSRYLGTARSYIPVAVCEYCVDSTGARSTEVIVTKTELDNAAISSIKNTLASAFAGLEWKDNNSPSPEIRNEFSKMVTTSSASARVKELTSKLFAADSHMTI
jgi:hypothetical protein